MRVLWVTNDLPPRAGGIQAFVANLLDRVHPATTTVVGPAGGVEAARHDAAQPYRTVRAPGAVLPTRRIRELVAAVAGAERPDVIVLGATWPLGELAGALHRESRVPIVGLTHGLEAGIAQAGGGRAIARATQHLAAVTTISDWTEERLRGHVRAPRLLRLPPGVDVERFRPDVDGRAQRAGWGIPDSVPLVGCVSRLVARKGQDVLVEAWPQVRAHHPAARLVLVGEGPRARSLARAVGALGPGSGTVLAGGVAWDELPSVHAALDVFVMPCRTRLGGLDVEGLGIVYLEAQASGVPAIAGRSGGAPEAVRDGVTGSVVDGRDPAAVATAIDRWLADPVARRAAGTAGRAWTEERWSWDAIATSFRGLLDEVVAAAA
jgi:phosphatidyl-myo-inositol dimannoside synthase